MTVQQINEGIELLNNINPDDPNAYTDAILAYKKIKYIPFFILDFPNLPIQVFRTRTHQNDELYENFSDIGLAPSAVTTNYGRCNIPGQPVFYCSDFRPTSYMELLEYWVTEKKGEYLHATISKWNINNSLRVLIVTSPFVQERISPYDRSHGEKLDRFIQNNPNETRSALEIFYKFLFDRFRKPAKNDLQTYIITSAYCNLAFEQNKFPVDAIFYPSVPFDGEGLNLAIKMGYDFENNLQLELVARNTFKRVDATSVPSFEEIALKEAKTINFDNKKIGW